MSIHMYSCTDVHLQCDDHSNSVATFCFTLARTYKYMYFLYVKCGLMWTNADSATANMYSLMSGRKVLVKGKSSRGPRKA